MSKPVDACKTPSELADKISLHLTMDEGSPGFLLNQADLQLCVTALRALAPQDNEELALIALNALKRRYPNDLIFANAGFAIGVCRCIVEAVYCRSAAHDQGASK